jgi:hemolysin III
LVPIPLFRRQPTPEDCLVSRAGHRPGQIRWHYDRAEIIADGIVHAAGIILGLVGAVAIVIVAAKTRPIEIAPTLIYIIGLITMLGFSAAYNMWPISPTKWLLRRFDHSAIYLLIAGADTPFLARM